MNQDKLPDLLDDIRTMIDKGATSHEVDGFLDQQNLSKDERSFLVKESQEYHLKHIQSDLNRQNNQVKYLLGGVVLLLVFCILYMSGLDKFMRSLMSPIGLILIFFGYQMFRRNRKLRE